MVTNFIITDYDNIDDVYDLIGYSLLLLVWPITLIKVGISAIVDLIESIWKEDKNEDFY